MFSVQRIKELSATLRFRLVIWITLVVFLMVVITNITVRAIEQHTVRQEYDQFLRESLAEVDATVAEVPADQLDAELKKKVRANAYHTWFLQLFNSKQQV